MAERLAGLLIVWAFAGADKVKVPLKDVPKAVLDSIKEKFPRAELTEATKETEDGKTTYEIALKDGGARGGRGGNGGRQNH